MRFNISNYGKIALLGAAMASCTVAAAAADKQLTADVVVVGGGGSGCAAAVSAAQHHAKVVLLEKESQLGGSTMMAEGMHGVETDQLRQVASPMTVDEDFKGAMTFNHYRAQGALVRSIIVRSHDTIDWLSTMGLTFDPVTISPSETRTWHLVGEYHGAHHGAAMVKALSEQAEKLGVTILTSTPATKLIMENGKVAGVEASNKAGDHLFIHAKAVILATGGFPNSKEMIAKYTRFDPDKVLPAIPFLHKVGDGINMAISAGADIDASAFGLMTQPGCIGKGAPFLSNLYTMSWQPILWVNKYGDRFVDETTVFNFGMAANAIESQRDNYAYSILDDTTQRFYAEKGADNGVGVLVMIGEKLNKLPEEEKNALAISSPLYFEDGTVEGLAVKLGMEPARLRKQIDLYNQMIERGHDDQFGKITKYMYPIKTGKLHAIKIATFALTSISGVRVDTQFRATDKQDKVIPGLYIAGSDVGGNYGDTYTLYTSGYALQTAATSGRVSGEDAAGFALGAK